MLWHTHLFRGILDYGAENQNTSTEYIMWTTYINQTEPVALSTLSIDMTKMNIAMTTMRIGQDSSTTSTSMALSATPTVVQANDYTVREQHYAG